MCCLHEPFLLYAAIIFMYLSSCELNKCHIVHSVPFVTSAIVCPPWIHIGLVLMRDPRYFIQREYQRIYRKYRQENKAQVLALEGAALKQSASLLKHVLEGHSLISEMFGRGLTFLLVIVYSLRCKPAVVAFT